MKEIERPDVERAAGEVHASRCFGFDDHGCELARFRGIFQSSQFDGLSQPPQAMTVMTVHGTAIISVSMNEQRTALSTVKESATAGGAVAGDELWAVLFFLGEGGVGLEAAAAAGVA